MATKNTQQTTATPASKGGRTFRGTVVAAKMKDTVTVAIERYVQHPKYKKFFKRTKKFLAHDAGNAHKEGDVVTIRETRPMSKRKHFEIVANTVTTE